MLEAKGVQSLLGVQLNNGTFGQYSTDNYTNAPKVPNLGDSKKTGKYNDILIFYMSAVSSSQSSQYFLCKLMVWAHGED